MTLDGVLDSGAWGRCVRLRSMGALYGHYYLRICMWKHKKSHASTLNGLNTILE